MSPTHAINTAWQLGGSPAAERIYQLATTTKLSIHQIKHTRRNERYTLTWVHNTLRVPDRVKDCRLSK